MGTTEIQDNDEHGVSIHFGPELSWDQTRPEAIEALRQVEESYRRWQKSQQRRSIDLTQREISESSPRKHLGLAVRHFGLFLDSCLCLLRIRTKVD